MKKQKKISYLDYACIIGERVQWKDIKGEKLEGRLISMNDNFLATIELDDKSIVKIQC